MTAPTPWPEGVLARYLTVAGATVDITFKEGDVHAACQGWRCPGKSWETTEVFYFDRGNVRDQKIAEALPPIQRWAQSHAETCRAMPKP